MTRTMRPVINAQNLKVVAIQGHPVAPVMPGVGDTLVWDGTEWVPTPMPQARVGSNAPRAAGETLNLQTTVVGIQGTPVFPVASFLAPGDALLWTGVDWKNYPVAKSLTASDLGPYLPISAYTPPGGGGDFLPLTGGQLSGPGNLGMDGTLTFTGGDGTVTANGSALFMVQTGDQYGSTDLFLANRDGLNGAMFRNHGFDFVDLAFQGNSGNGGGLRYNNTVAPAELQILFNGAIGAWFDSDGGLTTAGPISAEQALELYMPAGAPNWVAAWSMYLDTTDGNLAFGPDTTSTPRLELSTNGGIVGVTDGSNAAPGVVGEVFIATSTPPYVPFPNVQTTVNMVTATLPAGDWDLQGYWFLQTDGVIYAINGSISNVSATNAAPSAAFAFGGPSTVNTGHNSGNTLVTPISRWNVTTPTTIYLVAYAGTWAPTSVGTYIRGQGWIRGRRMR